MEADKRFTACRLCLCPSELLIGVFDYQDGYTPAEIITELLQFEVSMGDIYPQCVCGVCMGKLNNFKKFKELCCVFKASIDRAYAAKHVSAPRTTPPPAGLSLLPCKIEKIIPVEETVDQPLTTSIKEENKILSAEEEEIVIPHDNSCTSRDLAEFDQEQPVSNADKGEVVFPDHPTDIPLDLAEFSQEQAVPNADEGEVIIPSNPTDIPLIPHEDKTNLDIERDDKSNATICQDLQIETENEGDSEAPVTPLICADVSCTKNAEIKAPAISKATDEGPQAVEEVSGSGGQPAPTTSNTVPVESSLQPGDDDKEPRRTTRRVTRSMLSTPAQKKEEEAKGTQGDDSDDDANDWMEDDDSSSGSLTDMTYADSSDEEFMPETSKKFKANHWQSHSPSTSGTSNSAKKFKNSSNTKSTPKSDTRLMKTVGGTSMGVSLNDLERLRAMPTLSSAHGTVQGNQSKYPSTVENDEMIAEKRSFELCLSELLKSQGSDFNFPPPLVADRHTGEKPAMTSSPVEVGKVTAFSSPLQSGKSAPGKVNIILPKESLLMQRFFVPPDEVNRLLPTTLLDAISNKQPVVSSTSIETGEMISHPGPGESTPNKSSAVVPKESVPIEALKSSTKVSVVTGGKTNEQKGDSLVSDSMPESTETLSESRRSTRSTFKMPAASTSVASQSVKTISSDVEQVTANAQSSSDKKNKAEEPDFSWKDPWSLDDSWSSSNSESEESDQETHTGAGGQKQAEDGFRMKVDSLDSNVTMDMLSDGGQECPYCGKIYKNARSLRYHIDEHKFGRRFKCETCGKCYGKKFELKSHLVVHIESQKSVCSICGFRCKHSISLKKHMYIHGEKKYTCSTCGKKFSTIHALKHHNISHGESIYCCEVCGKRYRYKNHLNRHVKIHDSTKREAKYSKYVCDKCGNKYEYPSEMKKHFWSRHLSNRHKCSFCEKDFAAPEALERHIKLHKSEHQYRCDICDALLSAKSALDLHRKRHYGAKDYKCYVCGMEYTQNHNLKNHQKKHFGK